VIDRAELAQNLRTRFPNLEQLSDVLWRGVDAYQGRPYAIRYFDLSDDLPAAASHLSQYQERILGTSYFDPTAKSDLRWNHYLYFLTSRDVSSDPALAKAKIAIESDREYARKLVVTEPELRDVLDQKRQVTTTASLPPDPLSEWTKSLEKHDLGFVVDEALQVPAVVRHIARGDRQGLQRPPAAPVLDEAERKVATDSIRLLTIHHFRRYPVRRAFEFGIVNLISGVNGVGKTSLLESIEYLFCGRVRRSDGAPAKASVEGVLKDSGHHIRTTSGTPAAKLRARHLIWYGKADVRAVTLDDSFGKFNFLDTDAAVRLTVEQSQERINADLAQLLLGAEAAKTLDRFERLEKGLLEMKRDLERDVAIRDARRLDASTRLQQARSMPQESDQLFRALDELLSGIGWTARPSSKAGVESLPEALQATLVNLGIVKAADSSLPREADRIALERQRLSQATAELKTIRERTRELDEGEVDASRRIRTIDARANALRELVPMLDASLGDLAAEVASKTERVALLSQALADAEPASRVLADDETLLGRPLAQAVDEQAADVERQASALNESRRRLEAFERTQAALTNLTQQLRTVARQVIEHTHDQTHCPLCRTEFRKRELEARLQEGIQQLADDESGRLRQAAQELETAHQRSVVVLQSLRTLARYPAPKGRVTVRTVVSRISTERDELAALSAELERLRERVRDHAAKGWTLQRLTELGRSAGLSSSEIDRRSVEALTAALAQQRAQYASQIAGNTEERQRLSDQLTRIGQAIGVASRDLAAIDAAVSARAKSVEQVSRALAALAAQVDRSAISADLELEARIREASELAIRLRTATAQETEREAAIGRDAKVVEDATAEVVALRLQVSRIDSARAVIADLVQKQSGEALTAQVLRENGAQIAATFAKIHAPSEFDVEVDDDGFKILRRASKANVELHEMSSGQRSAFTLSLFLAMNERLKTGPRVIVFDDPVAHVDDINTLSFLDHLREIALNGGRQVFFATADSKLAGLFARKFRFMGDEFRQIDLARD